jgi:hypothetical protein
LAIIYLNHAESIAHPVPLSKKIRPMAAKTTGSMEL